MSPTDEIKEEIALEEESKAALTPRSHDKYTPLQGFATSLELYAFIDDQLQTGEITPHKWQVEESEFLCQPDVFSKSNPLKYLLVACNSSGKDAYVIAPFAIWHCITKIRSRCIITSSSDTQMKDQTEAYIRTLANRINELFGEKVFVVKHHHIVCKWTGSEIKLFVTDESGRAEGYHPFPDYKQGEVCVIINEGKTVGTPIYNGLLKCTYNRFLVISSPGPTSGFMYDKASKSVQHPEKYVDGKWYSRRVSYLDCPHIEPSRIQAEIDDVGEDSIWFRNTRKAEFTSMDESVVITAEAVTKCLRSTVKKHAIKRGLHAGLDLAAGGDELTFYVYDDNKFVGKEISRHADTYVSVNLCVMWFEKYGFKKEEAWRIIADHGGMGVAFAGHFRDKGWELSWCTNQHKPNRPRLYGNKGTENWFNLSKLIQRCLIELPQNDEKLIAQLGNRYLSRSSRTDKVVLQNKPEARAEGKPSPDRADALVLCFMGTSYQDFEGYESPKPNGGKVITHVTTDLLVKKMEEQKWQGHDMGLRQQLSEVYGDAKAKQQKTIVSVKPKGILYAYRHAINN